MYSKKQAAVLKEQFWTSLGLYMALVSSADGTKINWINYKTGVRFINFRMDVENDHAYIGIEITHGDATLQQLFFDHFASLKMVLEKKAGENLIWETGTQINGKHVSRIYQTLGNVNIYSQADWPQIISFLKSRMIALDSFWVENKEIFEMLP